MIRVLPTPSSRDRSRGALSLRLGAQTLSRAGREWVAAAWVHPASGVANPATALPVGVAQALAVNLSRYGRGGEPKRAGEGAEPERAAMPERFR